MRSAAIRSVASVVLVAASVLFTGWGCGGGGAAQPETPEPDPSTLAPAPDLTIYVKVEAATAEAEQFLPNITTSLTSTLTAAGYKLVASEDAKPDVHAKIAVNATEEQSFFNVQVNGKTQASYKVSLNASFVSAADAAVIDQATSEFLGKDGVVEDKAIRKIMIHLGSTGKLAAYGNNAKAKERQVETDLWTAANVEGCKKPQTAKACDGVKEYIEKFPSGKYTAEARQAIQDGEVQAGKMKEDDLWKAAAVDQCKKPTKSYDCKGVDEYLEKYPTGAYAADAKGALKASEKAREGLKKSEDANKKKASREECVKDCRRAYETYAAFEILVNRCVATECQ